MSLADELDREAQIDHNTLGFNYIVSYNIRSLRYKTDKLRDILHCENENKTNNISIIALQEIWDIKGINTDLENFQKLIFAMRNSKGGGGAGLYINKKISFRKIDMFSIKNNYMESVCVHLTSGPWNDTIILNIYKNDRSNIKNFTNWIEKTCFTLRTLFNNPKCIICGDFNEDMNDLGETPIALCLESNGFTQNIRKPTRITDTSKTRLDNIFTNFQSKGLTTNPGFSDHHACAIFKDKPQASNIEKGKSISELLKLRRWTKEEISNLKDFLREHINLHELENLTTQEAANKLDEIIKEGITKYVHEKTINKRKSS